jgi:hypothetical protein
VFAPSSAAMRLPPLAALFYFRLAAATFAARARRLAPNQRGGGPEFNTTPTPTL